jgi:hypothetical protein
MLWRIAVGTIVGSLFVSAMGPVAAAMAQPAATAEERRNDVAALLGAGRRATLDDLAAAAALADAAALDAPDEPWGYLARCDIARRLGNAEVLRACQRDLERVAPRHPETLKVLAGSVASASGGVWLARTVLLGALLGTLGHALARRRRSLRRRRASVGRPVATVFALVTSLVAGGGVALSDETPQSRCEVAARMGDGSTSARRSRGCPPKVWREWSARRTRWDADAPAGSWPGPSGRRSSRSRFVAACAGSRPAQR